MRTLTSAVLVLALTVACSAPSGDVVQAGSPAETAAVRAEIDRANANIERWIANGQLDSVVAMYTADAWTQGPNMTPKMGRDSIRALWGGMMQMGKFSLIPRADDVVVMGNYAVERGSYEMSFERPPNAPREVPPSFKDKGGYMVLWEKQGDRWLLKWDLGSSQMPMPALAR